MNGACFIGFEKSDCKELSSKNGTLYFGKDFFEEPFFLNFSSPSELTDDTLYQTKDLKHYCSSLLIIDKYLFDDKTKEKVKIKNLIQIIENLIPKLVDRKFEIDIISENKDSNNSMIESKIGKILKHFEDRISLHVYSPIHLKESDRFFITNYIVITVPHPLDRETTISSNFFLSHENSERVLSGYELWTKKVNDAALIIKNCPETIGMTKCVWKKDNLEHSIFRKSN